MKLSTRLGFGLGMIILMLAGVGATGLLYVESLTELTTQLYRHPFAVSTAAHRLEGNVQRLRRAAHELVVQGDASGLELQTRAIDQAKSEIVTDLQTLRERFLGDPKMVERVAQDVAGFQSLTEQIIALLVAQRGSEARALERRLGGELAKELDEALGAVSAFAATKATSFRAETELARSEALTTLSVLAVLTSLLAMALALFTTRSVLRQVGGEPAEISAVTRQIAGGDLEVSLAGRSGIAEAVAKMAASFREVIDQAKAIAAGDYSVEFAPRSERDQLGIALRDMNLALHRAAAARDHLNTGLARLDESMRGDPDLHQLAGKVVSEIATHLEAQMGALYLAEGEDGAVMALAGSYAYVKRKNLSQRFALGEGIVGQAALEKQQILIRNVPEDYVQVASGLGERVPRFICVTPFLYEGRLMGVIEVGTLHEFSDAQRAYLNRAMPALAIAVHGAKARTQLALAFKESQRLTEELQTQQEELRVTNEELEQQAQQLKSSEERLRVQQEELQVTNEELEEKNDLLECQKREVEQAQAEITLKADELALASKYKSEFLANMSHELRTPLNSLLLLAQNLAQNKPGNLSDEQIEYARIIHGSGSDLLNLINEILDLSKIEAGRMELQIGAIRTEELRDRIRASFAHLAKDKGLALELNLSEGAPPAFHSDRQRLEQILRNLVSNAIKFTSSGRVTVTFGRPAAGTQLSRSGLSIENCLMISVADTGIGIPQEKQKLIFEAFQQADGGTSRRFGGTGLGLTISRELAALLGGEIQLKSAPDQGATFSLYLPTDSGSLSLEQPAAATDRASPETAHSSLLPLAQVDIEAPYIDDDRDRLLASDQVILVIEDDPKFAHILLSKCHEKGFKCLATPTGEAGLALVARHLPRAVILDIRLPGMDGLAVLAALKEDTRTRHIPVHMVSVDEHDQESLRRGAVGHTVKPLDQERLDEIFCRLDQICNSQTKRVLVVEDDAQLRAETVSLIEDQQVHVDQAATGAQALAALRGGDYDCLVLDLRLPDMGGRELIEQLEQEGVVLPPVVVHTAYDLSEAQERELREHTESIVVKDVRSRERLLDEVTLFLHRVVNELPDKQQKIIRNLHDPDAQLRDRKVLVVDDDMRTSFAMSRLLSDRGLRPLKAENGERALQMLAQHSDTELVLMDIMMPVMDGYETMRRIRADQQLSELPIIALTAKAMPEDRHKCLEAGANDYLTKPVDAEQLLSIMRVWLCQ